MTTEHDNHAGQPAASGRPRWSSWDILTVFLIGYGIIPYGWQWLMTTPWLASIRQSTELSMLLTPLVTGLGWLILVGFMAWRHPETGLRGLGWHWPESRLQLYCGTLLTLAAMLAVSLVSLAVSAMLPEGQSVRMNGAMLNTPWIWQLLVFGVLAPFSEETVFRGLLLTSMTVRYPVWLTVVLISLVFALSHSHYLGSWLALVTVFIQSVILCVARIKTDSLAPTFLAHAVYNFIAIVRIWLMPI